MAERTLTLAQVVGRLKQAREASNRAGAALRNGLKDTHVTGHNRKFIEDDEEKGLLNQNQDEYKAVALDVMDQLHQDAEVTAKALDWALTQDVANCTAKADVIVDGEVLLSQVPISHLLHLQTVFSEYKAVILTQLPILEPTKDWGEARDPVKKLWKSRTEVVPVHIKQSRALLLHSGTDKHAPQAVPDPNPLPIHIGTRETTIWSGAVSEREKRQLLAKADTLIAALKEAIAVADHAPAQKQAEGDKLFRYLLG
jgi:hypothetical protein